MKGFVTILFTFLISYSNAQNKLGAIGQWRAHFDNHSIEHVIKGDYIYAASPYQIIRIDGNNKYWIDKTNGLSDINISHIAWDENQKQLLVIYANSNIDIVKGDQVYNINAVQLTNLFPDKKINATTIYQNWALLATNFGIVIIDLLKHEVKSNWFPNNNQQSISTYDVLIANDSIYASTANGIWASVFNTNAIQPNQWTHLAGYDSYSLKKLILHKGNVYGYSNHDLFQFPQTSPLIHLGNTSINNIDASLNNLNISIQYANQKGALWQLNKDLSFTTILDTNVLSIPKKILIENNNYWIADSLQGLLLKNNTVQWVNMGGPKASIKGISDISENALVTPFASGTNGFGKFNESIWNSYSQIGSTQLPILNAAAINILDQSFWFAGNASLIHYVNENKVESIQPNNSIGNYKQIKIDAANTIWALQDQQGLVKQNNNSWNSIPLPSNYNKSGLTQFIVNRQGQAWLIAPSGQGLYVYQGKTNYPNEVWKQFTTQSSSGNLPSTNVTSISQDLRGSIWVGTDNGIGIFNCGDIASEPCNAYLPIVNNNGFNGYLFQKEIVHCIAVDGANRKWIGTNNGAWLLSEDGNTIIEHFTKLNSPLPNDTVNQILIQPNSGEVFINTSNQMVSYRGTATKGAQNQSSIQIFPNPIPSNFSGNIAMRGLVENALVKITDLNGKLLYQTTALGGQALWNGKNYEGRKVATGIYLVFVRDLSGNEKSVGKIVIADGY
jgi:hypothetical protein